MLPKTILIIGTLLLGLAACSTTPKIQEFADTANATDELQTFSAAMGDAKSRQVDVLAPTAYREAFEAQADAVKLQKNGKDSKVVLHTIALGRAQLNRANQFAALSRTNLEAVVAARTAAIKAGAPTVFPEDFKDADDNLRSTTSEIENNDLSDVAEERDSLQKQYLTVELKTITHVALGASKATIALAEKEGADEYARQSLAIARKNVSDAEAYIIANRHQTEAVKARSESAVKTSNHLLKITRASKAGKNVSNEQAALLADSQTELLAAEKKSSEALSDESEDLRGDAAFNKSFESARREFTSQEAEVYRQGNQLVIRLRSLEFPTNQAVIRGSNFPLLGKVAKVVKGFENSTVTIEGHTDSVGGREQNIKLSKERAQAFSDYLVENNAIARDKITVAGYGFERPLAPNKTAKGKAQNRRVDVIISPVG